MKMYKSHKNGVTKIVVTDDSGKVLKKQTQRIEESWESFLRRLAESDRVEAVYANNA
jgi:hypothetical protein